MIFVVVMGIYKIENLQNGKIYIGSSKNISLRWNQHINSLKRNKHHSAHLQYAWNLYGEKSFSFSIIEKLEEVDDLLKREQFYLDQYKSFDENLGYNICGLVGKPTKHNNSNPKYRKLMDDYDLELKEQLKFKYEFIGNQEAYTFESSNLNTVDDVFIILLNGLFNYYNRFELIHSGVGCEIKLYTKNKNINVHNFQDLSSDAFIDIIDNNYFEMMKIDDFRHGTSLNIYRNELLWYRFVYDRTTRFCKLVIQSQYEIDEIILSYIG